MYTYQKRVYQLSLHGVHSLSKDVYIQRFYNTNLHQIGIKPESVIYQRKNWLSVKFMLPGRGEMIDRLKSLLKLHLSLTEELIAELSRVWC